MIERMPAPMPRFLAMPSPSGSALVPGLHPPRLTLRAYTSTWGTWKCILPFICYVACTLCPISTAKCVMGILSSALSSVSLIQQAAELYRREFPYDTFNVPWEHVVFCIVYCHLLKDLGIRVCKKNGGKGQNSTKASDKLLLPIRFYASFCNKEA